MGILEQGNRLSSTHCVYQYLPSSSTSTLTFTPISGPSLSDDHLSQGDEFSLENGERLIGDIGETQCGGSCERHVFLAVGTLWTVGDEMHMSK